MYSPLVPILLVHHTLVVDHSDGTHHVDLVTMTSTGEGGSSICLGNGEPSEAEVMVQIVRAQHRALKEN